MFRDKGESWQPQLLGNEENRRMCPLGQCTSFLISPVFVDDTRTDPWCPKFKGKKYLFSGIKNPERKAPFFDKSFILQMQAKLRGKGDQPQTGLGFDTLLHFHRNTCYQKPSFAGFYRLWELCLIFSI